MRFFVITVVAAIAGASAYDLRQLYTFKGGNAVAFCKKWKCAWCGFHGFEESIKKLNNWEHVASTMSRQRTASTFCQLAAGLATTRASTTPPRSVDSSRTNLNEAHVIRCLHPALSPLTGMCPFHTTTKLLRRRELLLLSCLPWTWSSRLYYV
jgi:hypothetical protein